MRELKLFVLLALVLLTVGCTSGSSSDGPTATKAIKLGVNLQNWERKKRENGVGGEAR